MTIEFPCTGCQKTLRVTALSAGKQARCPACGAISLVPATAAAGAMSLAPPAPASSAAAASPFGAPPRKPAGEPFSRTAPARPDANPYVSPAAISPFGAAAFRPNPAQMPLATRGTRFLGAILDALIHLAAFVPGLLVFIGLLIAQVDEDVAFGTFAISMLLGVLIALGIAIYNWVLISKTGQSIAKRMLGMRIIRNSTGELPGFLHGVLLRIWVPGLINEACNLFSIVDACWIFGEECRCLHDLIADTKVIDVRGEYGDINRF